MDMVLRLMGSPSTLNRRTVLLRETRSQSAEEGTADGEAEVAEALGADSEEEAWVCLSSAGWRED